MSRLTIRFGVDTGGTFTDVVMAKADGSLAIRKIDNAQKNVEANILRGVVELLKETSSSPKEIERIVHCTTILGNALIQRKGPKTALLTTKGFRDVLELRRQHNPVLYEVFWEKPASLVPRRLCYEISERIGADGSIVTPLDVDSARRLFTHMRATDVQSIAICLINSCVNPIHERMLADLAARELPTLTLSVSSEISPEWGEYERTSTTVADAFVKPILRDYLDSLVRRLSEIGIQAPVEVMQSAGGILPAVAAVERPVFCIDSGPAAGVMATCALSRLLRIPNVVTLEIGGTTAKSCLIEDAKAHRKTESEFGTPVGPDGRSLRGGGDALRIPVIDTAEVGAGGGSIARVDGGGSLSVGPDGAGAIPGPVCYDRGGRYATLTDANLVLGYLSEDHPLGGEIKLNRAAGETAIAEQIAKPLKLSTHDAAQAIRSVATAMLARAIRSVSIERGRDVRRFALFASGGGGPAHAADIARMLGIKRVIIPPLPGLFNAIGLLWSPLEYHLAQAARIQLGDPQAEEKLADVIDALSTRAARLAGMTAASALELRPSADINYAGQFHSLTIDFRYGRMSPAVAAALRRNFETEHNRAFGYISESEPIEIRTVRLAASPKSRNARTTNLVDGLKRLTASLYQRKDSRGRCSIFFGRPFGYRTASVLSRADLTNKKVRGPLVFPEYDTTVVVPPDFTAYREANGCLVLESI